MPKIKLFNIEVYVSFFLFLFELLPKTQGKMSNITLQLCFKTLYLRIKIVIQAYKKSLNNKKMRPNLDFRAMGPILGIMDL